MNALEERPDADTAPDLGGGGDPALWQRLLESRDTATFLAAFLPLQARYVTGMRSGAVFLVGSSGLQLVGALPQPLPLVDEFAAAAQLATEQQRAVLRESGRSGRSLRLIAHPVELDGRLVAIAVVALAVARGEAGEPPVQQVRELQWSISWLRDHLRSRDDVALRLERDSSRATLDLLAAVVDRSEFRAAALAAVTEMALRFDCVRVSLGFVRFGAARVAAISHTSSFSHRMKLVQQLAQAMDEAIDQRAMLRYPAPPEDVVFTHAHAELAAEQRHGYILTVPLLVVDRFEGAICFERDRPFDAASAQMLGIVAAALGPVLAEKRRNDRWLIVKVWDALVEQLKRLVGPGHVVRKLVVAGLIAVVAALSFWTDTYRVIADAQVEAAERRAIVSAYDGFVQTATARAGDVVKAGDELASLEDRELSLERLRWVTERQQRQLEYDRALAAREPASVNIVKSQIDQADAQIELIDEQIARTRLVAPFDGLVVSGDLSQRIGASVSRGETLFELSPLSAYRVVITVGERDIASLTPGQTGEVVFASMPEQPVAMRIERITPVATQKADGNGFRVEATVTGGLDRLRPGLTGVARIATERMPVIAIWTRPVLDWLGLMWWRLVP